MKKLPISSLRSLEGCAKATDFLSKIYGKEITNLKRRKDQFRDLSKRGKEVFVITFLLNSITKPFRKQFISQIAGTYLTLLEEQDTRDDAYDLLQEFQSQSFRPIIHERIKRRLIFLQPKLSGDFITFPTTKSQWNKAKAQESYFS